MPDLTCPMCGTPVRIVSSGEGTNHYEPIAEESARIFESANTTSMEIAEKLADDLEQSQAEVEKLRAERDEARDTAQRYYELGYELEKRAQRAEGLARELAEAARPLCASQTKPLRTWESAQEIAPLRDALARYDEAVKAQ